MKTPNATPPPPAPYWNDFRASIVDQISDAVVGFAFDGRITFWNAAAERMYGFTAAQAVGSINRDVFDYDYGDGTTDEEVGRIVLEGGSWVREVRHTTKVGREFDVNVSLALQRDERGRPVGILAVFRDITEFKRTRDALSKAREMFQRFMDHSPVLAFMKDHDGCYVYTNSTFLHVLNLTRDQVIGKTDAELWNAPDEAERLRENDLAVWDGDAPIQLRRTTNIAPYGLRHWWVYKFPVRDDTGRKLIAGLSLDMTEQVNAENQLRERERTYREASETNRALLTELDHRVRNNLANLIGLVELMRDRTADVNVFADALDGRLRAMAHVHQSMADTGYHSVDLKELAGSLLEVARGIASHPVPVEVDGPPVRVGPEQVSPLTMILLEWFTNCCKYGAGTSAAGRVALTWEVARPDAGGSIVKLRWRESAGPPITGPIRESLGTSLVHSFATRELRGTCELRYPGSGVDHEIAFPVAVDGT